MRCAGLSRFCSALCAALLSCAALGATFVRPAYAGPPAGWKFAWTELETDIGAWGLPALVWLGNRERLLAVGHRRGEVLTSEWDGKAWRTLATADVTSGPWPEFLAYDSHRQRAVAFSRGEQTLEWDGSSWLSVASAHRPPDRADPCLAFDPVRGRVVLFGGDLSPGVLQDTWEWDGTDWNQVAGDGPVGRKGCTMAFDSARGRTVLHGGWFTDNSPEPDSVAVAVRDTWAWDGASWSLISEDGPESYGASMAYDEARDQMVLFWHGETWEFDGSHWQSRPTPLRPPTNVRHQVVYDAVRARVVVSGGDLRDAIWSWDGVAWRMDESASIPEFGGGHQLVVDPSGQRTWMLVNGNEVWMWEGRRWRQAPPGGPIAASGAAATFDAERGRLVMFGGIRASAGDAVARTDETWEWDGATWTQAHPATAPKPRDRAKMAYDPIRRRVVLFGGGDGTFDTASYLWFGDTWEWDGAQWELRATSGPTHQSANSAMVFDPAIGRVLLVGAADAVSCPETGATWAWDGAEWTLLHAEANLPNPAAQLMYHELVGRVVLLYGGGCGNPGPNVRGHFWDWDENEWSSWPFVPGPSNAGTATYDSFFRHVVYFQPGEGYPSGGASTWIATVAQCLSDDDCETAQCEDGVCCDQDCGDSDVGDCRACSVAAGAGEDGVCGLVRAGRLCRRDGVEGPALACDGVSLDCGGKEGADAGADAEPGNPPQVDAPAADRSGCGAGCATGDRGLAGDVPCWAALLACLTWRIRKRRQRPCGGPGPSPRTSGMPQDKADVRSPSQLREVALSRPALK